MTNTLYNSISFLKNELSPNTTSVQPTQIDIEKALTIALEKDNQDTTHVGLILDSSFNIREGKSMLIYDIKIAEAEPFDIKKCIAFDLSTALDYIIQFDTFDPVNDIKTTYYLVNGRVAFDN